MVTGYCAQYSCNSNSGSNLQELLDCVSLLSVTVDYWLLSNSNRCESETVLLRNQKGISGFR